MILISACLAGFNTRYDGTNCGEDRFIKLVADGKAIPVCPEELGGLKTPREPVELLKGSTAIGRDSGKDYSSNFMKGADEVLEMAKLHHIKRVILKDGSPSCGSTYIKIDGGKCAGRGITAELLIKEGIIVETERIRYVLPL